MSATSPQPAASSLCLVMHDLLATLLVPHILEAVDGDRARAYAAARDIIDAEKTRSTLDLIFIAQAVAFSLSALRTVGEAAADDLSPQEATRLTAHADRLSQAANRSRRAAERGARPRAPSRPQPQAVAVRPPAAPPARPHSPSPSPADTRAAWAAAIADVAQEFAASLPPGSPANTPNAIRAAALRSTARDLLHPRGHQPL